MPQEIPHKRVMFMLHPILTVHLTPYQTNKQKKRENVGYHYDLNPQRRRKWREKEGKRKRVGYDWNELGQPLKGETGKMEGVFITATWTHKEGSNKERPQNIGKEKRCWNIKGTCGPNPVMAKKTSYLAVWLPWVHLAVCTLFSWSLSTTCRQSWTSWLQPATASGYQVRWRCSPDTTSSVGMSSIHPAQK